MDVIGLAFVLPTLYLINDPELAIKNQYLELIYINSPFFGNPIHFATFIILLLPCIFILKNILGIMIIHFQNKFVSTLAVEIITTQYKKYLNKDYLYFKENNSNFILRNIATIPNDFTQGVVLPTITFTTELLVAIFIVLAISFYNFMVFALLMIVLVPLVGLFYISIRKKVSDYGKKINDIRATTFKTVFEAIFGIEDVKLSNKGKYFIKRSIAPLSFYYNLYVKLTVLKNAPTRVLETAAIMSIAIIYLLFSFVDTSSASMLSTLIVFATAAYRLMPSLNRMMSSLIDIKNKSYVFDFLKKYEESNKVQIEEKTIQFNNEIKLSNINFGYDETPILNKLNITVKKGDKIGIIGESGSGKSTLLKIILGFLNPSSGVFEVDGTEKNNSTKISWNMKLGYVKQDFYLLDGSLSENIAFGEDKKSVDKERLSQVIELSQLKSLVDKLESGVDTNIGEFGGNLSGGQRQRIAIARALYKNAEILLFDEATSALDNETENEIIETINNLKDKDYTIIMIAHRISSLKFCDKILEIKNGKISNQFTYEELYNEQKNISSRT